MTGTSSSTRTHNDDLRPRDRQASPRMDSVLRHSQVDDSKVDERRLPSSLCPSSNDDLVGPINVRGSDGGSTTVDGNEDDDIPSRDCCSLDGDHVHDEEEVEDVDLSSSSDRSCCSSRRSTRMTGIPEQWQQPCGGHARRKTTTKRRRRSHGAAETTSTLSTFLHRQLTPRRRQHSCRSSASWWWWRLVIAAAGGTALSRSMLSASTIGIGTASAFLVAPSSPLLVVQQGRREFVGAPFMATSSSELKKKRKPSSTASSPQSSSRSTDKDSSSSKAKLPRNSVVRRLKRAATLAVEEANQRKQRQEDHPAEQSDNRHLNDDESRSSRHPPPQTSSSSTSGSGAPQSHSPSFSTSTSTSSSSATHSNPLPTLRQLTQIIDKRLQHPFGSKGGTKSGGTSAVASSSSTTAVGSSSTSGAAAPLTNLNANTPPDSMGALYMHNHLNPRNQTDSCTRHVAVVLAKPIRDDRLTVEGAARVRYLLQSILEGRYSPHLVVFCGPVSGPNNKVSDADASYMYFRNLWECTIRAHRNRFGSDDAADGMSPASTATSASSINLASSSTPAPPRRPEFYLVRMPIDQGGLQNLAQHIQQTYVPRWWDEIVASEAREKALIAESDSSPPRLEASMTSTAPAAESTAAAVAATKRVKPKKLQIHFSLVASEYQLCQLNDIHMRSPNQSALRALRSLGRTSSSSMSSTPARTRTSGSTPLVEQPTWSFYGVTSWLYSSSPASQDATADGASTQASNGGTGPASSQQQHHPLRAFCAKTYKTAQHMVPVLYNLRGVVEHREFFQRDNYRALVAARRSLISDMERMYHLQPGLSAVHIVSGSGSSSVGSSMSNSGTATSKAPAATTSEPASTTAAKTASSNPTATYFASIGSIQHSSSSSASSTTTTGASSSHLSVASTDAGSSHSNIGDPSVLQANKPLDVVLESALLSVGRCLDLVRPAGLLTGSVSMDDFKRALTSLQQAYYLLDRACDPDEPLPADEWSRPLSLEPSASSGSA